MNPPASTTRSSPGRRREAQATAEVISIERGEGRLPLLRPAAPLSALATVVALALAISPLWAGYYAEGIWAPLALGAVVLLMVVALAAQPAFTRLGLTAGGALLLLLLLSAISMLWAESRDSAWTASNQLALYVVVFAIGLLAVRERAPARAIMLILGTPALLTSVILAVALIAGGGHGAFLTGRLNSPMGYINGAAGLLVMGIWPWVALAETATRRSVRVAALAAAASIASTAVLTQSRAIVPATLLATILVLVAAPQRTRRAANLLLIAAAVALSAHWTLAVYSSTGPTQSVPAPDHVLRGAGLAILAASVVAGLLKLALASAAGSWGEERRRRVTLLAGRALLAVTVAALALVAALGHSTISRQYDAFTHMQLEQSAQNRFLSGGGFRYDLWRVALDEFKDHPLGGLGAGNYDVEYYRLRRNSSQFVVVPHSIELQMAAELGIGGLVALLAFGGAILWAGVAPRGRTLAAQDPMIRIAALGLFTAFLAGTSVDWLYNFPGLAGAAFLAAALLVVPARSDGRRDAPPRRRRQAALVLGMAVLALIAAGVGRQFAATRYAAGGAAKAQTAPRQALGTLRTAEQLDPYSLSTYYSIATAYASLGNYAGARDALLEAERREPHNYVPPALLGDLAMRAGYYRAAAAEYARARALDPQDVYVRADLAGARAALR